MKKKKNHKKPTSKNHINQNTVSYVCAKCGNKEEIPDDVLEYFDEINPMELIYGSHQFFCEKCGTGIMKPEKEPEIIVRGYGLFDGFERG